MSEIQPVRRQVLGDWLVHQRCSKEEANLYRGAFWGGLNERNLRVNLGGCGNGRQGLANATAGGASNEMPILCGTDSDGAIV
jgi:hypothetical protein